MRYFILVAALFAGNILYHTVINPAGGFGKAFEITWMQGIAVWVTVMAADI